MNDPRQTLIRIPFAAAPRRQAPLWTAAVMSTALLVVGCDTMTPRQQGTAQGAGVGAVAGAIIGSATGGSAGKSAVIGGALGAVAGNLWSKRLEDKRRALEQASAGTGVSVDRTADNRLRVNVPSDISFRTGSAEIQPQMRPVLDELGRNLDRDVRVTVVGHTDSTGPDSVNDPLSLERAESVRDYLARRGLSPSQIAVTGRGSREPIAPNTTEAGRAQNRRVEIFLSDQQG